MNSAHEQLPQTVTANSALNQNWVGCTVRTPQNPGRAHTAGLVPRSWALLCTRQAGHARMRALSRAKLRLLRLPPSLPNAQVATPNSNRLGRDLKSMSRPAFALSTETPLSRPKTLVTTPNHHTAARIMSRHQIGVATPLKPLQVANSKRSRDTVSPAQSPSQVATRKSGHDPSWRLTYVATSISCRDLVSAHSRISRSRRPTPGRDLPHCYPCRDLKMMSRPQNDAATSNQLSPLSATSGHHFVFPCRDLPC